MRKLLYVIVTYDTFYSVDALIRDCAGVSEHSVQLATYQLRPDGTLKPIPQRTWIERERRASVANELSLSQEKVHNERYVQWKHELLALIPTDAVVKVAELESFLQKNYAVRRCVLGTEDSPFSHEGLEGGGRLVDLIDLDPYVAPEDAPLVSAAESTIAAAQRMEEAPAGPPERADSLVTHERETPISGPVRMQVDWSSRISPLVQNESHWHAMTDSITLSPPAQAGEGVSKSPSTQFHVTDVEAPGPSSVVATPPAGASPPSDGSYQFTREGEAWKVVYGGQSGVLKHRRGLAYIAHLLQRPGQRVSAEELYYLVNRRPPINDSALAWSDDAHLGHDTPLDEEAAFDGGAALDEIGVRITTLSQGIKMYEDEELQTLIDQVNELKKKESKARELGNTRHADQYRKDWEILQKHIAPAIGKKGQSRRVRDDVKRVTDAVGSRIRDEFKRISAQLPALAEHLRESIQIGNACVYLPRSPMNWTVRLR